MRDETLKDDSRNSTEKLSCSEIRTRHPQVLIAEAQEIYYLQTCLCAEVKRGERKADRHFSKAFMILEQMYCEIMRDANAMLSTQSQQ
jgi:hypothetical protein